MRHSFSDTKPALRSEYIYTLRSTAPLNQQLELLLQVANSLPHLCQKNAIRHAALNQIGTRAPVTHAVLALPLHRFAAGFGRLVLRLAVLEGMLHLESAPPTLS